MKVVIGYGNPLRGDDGVAHRVVESCVGDRGVSVVAVHQLVPELAASIADAELVVFVDAAVACAPGTVTCGPIAGAPAHDHGHALTPASLLCLTRDTFGSAPPAWLVRIGAADFAFGRPLSAAVSAAVPKATELVRSCLTS